MTKDDIIKLALECDLLDSRDDLDHPTFAEIIASVERFANLVAAHECEQIAQMIEDAPPLMEFAQNDKGGCMVCGFTPKLAAEFIRARSQS